MEYLADADGYVDFGDVSRKELGKQCQYGSRYVTKLDEEYPDLGEGLRFRNLDRSYHEIKIHIDDIPEFVRRYNEHIAQ